MEVIDEFTLSFFGILPRTSPPTGKRSSPPVKKTVVLKFLLNYMSTMPPVLELSMSTTNPCTQTQLMTTSVVLYSRDAWPLLIRLMVLLTALSFDSWPFFAIFPRDSVLDCRLRLEVP